MTIFVQRASECLTDHLPHGDGLICHSLLRGLVDRGHRLFAYTNHDAVAKKPDGLTVRGRRHWVPANALADWEHAWRAGRWLSEVGRRESVDLVWRMHPYGTGCPTVPHTGGRPLVVGPLFYDWPANLTHSIATGRPRLGVGLKPLLDPIARHGWERTLQAATLVLCSTNTQSAQTRARTAARVETLPVSVDPPAGLADRVPAEPRQCRLIFVANLVANKRADLFCAVVSQLRRDGLTVKASIVGDGPERATLQSWCRSNGLSEDVVEFTGRVPNADIYRQLVSADLLVSTSNGEPYGRAIVEAMSVGTPAVCHRSGGPADIISDSVDGALVDDLDAASFARRIAELVRSGRLSALSTAALTKAATWKSNRVMDRLEELLLDVVRPVR